MTIAHKAVYSYSNWHDKYDHNVYDYNDGVNLADDYVNDCFVVNVPCYNVEDIALAMTGRKSRYFSHHTQIELHTHIFHIRTSNHTGKQHQYLLATPEIDEYVKQHAVFGIIKGNTRKLPKKHLKVVRVFNRGTYKDDSKHIECYTQDNDTAKYLTNQVREAA